MTTANNIPSFPRANLFGAQAAPAQAAPQERPKAQFWVNVGYVQQIQRVATDGSVAVEDVFVSLPYGLPLDTMTKADTSSRNVEFSALMSARNNLLDQVLEVAKTLQPGEEKIIGGVAGGLQLQLRHVSAPAAEIATDVNPFIKPITL